MALGHDQSQAQEATPVITLELNDAGIVAAAGSPPRLLPVDDNSFESPGYALPGKRRVLMGLAAQRRALKYPYDIQNRFWDQLNNQPLAKPLPGAGTQAELAHLHLEQVWRRIQPHGSRLMVTVPGYFDRHRMGLFLTMARESAIPVAGFMHQAVAAPPLPVPDSTMLVVDAHLHRTEVSLIEQDALARLHHKATLALDETGLVKVHQTLISSIAETFVRTTRIDPLHHADSEQALYDRLPELLSRLTQQSAATLALPFDRTPVTATVTRERLADQTRPFMAAVAGLIRSVLKDRGKPRRDLVVLLSARVGELPGAHRILSGFEPSRLVRLAPGAGALNLLTCLDDLDLDSSGAEAPFFTSRTLSAPTPPPLPAVGGSRPPTHLLLDSMAVPITSSSLYISRPPSHADGLLGIDREPPADGRWVCTVQAEGSGVRLRPQAPSELLVDGVPVIGPVDLALGQVLTAPPAKGRIQLIACLT
jgi:hypothetical protein